MVIVRSVLSLICRKIVVCLVGDRGSGVVGVCGGCIYSGLKGCGFCCLCGDRDDFVCVG